MERFHPSFSLEQITQVRTLGDFTLSPDGRRAAYTIAGYYYNFPVTPRFGEENNIRVLTLATGEIRWVTSGTAPKRRPVFSPAGDALAFESDNDVWVVRLTDGAITRVTSDAGRDREPVWAPGGDRLAFVSSRGGQTNVWIASVQGEQHGLWRVTSDPLAKSDPQWSPDGQTILFTGNRSDEYYSQGVFRAPAVGGPSDRLTPDDGFDYSTARWSPDGQLIAYLADRNGYVHVWTMRPDGRGAREFDTGRHDAMSPYWIVQPVWSRDGREIMISVNRAGRYELDLIAVGTGRVETVGKGPGQYHEVGWADDGSLVYSYENAWSPPDLHLRRRMVSQSRQLTHSSHVVFREQHMAEVRRVAFPSLDGIEIQGFLLMPRDRRDGERLPAVVNLHPNGYGQFYDHWNPFLHYVAQAGYVMLLVDQRGSSGYGRAFREAQIGAWGTKTFDDVKAAAAYLRAQPFVDHQRLGVMGLSFGGYQALLALTKTPDLFHAGVDMMGPTDRRGGFTDKYRTLQIGKTEAEAPELYERISPITSVRDLKAPLLVLHSDQDRNVSPKATHQLLAELDRHKKAYEAHIYPGEAHGLADPANQLDSYRRIVSFFERHLRARPTGVK